MTTEKETVYQIVIDGNTQTVYKNGKLIEPMSDEARMWTQLHAKAINTTEQPKSAEEISKQVPWELQIVRNIWRRAYLDSEESHVKILKDYGDLRESSAQQRIKELEENLAFEIRVANGQTEINKELAVDLEEARQRIKELEEQYNALGVKFDKELERWQERDAKVMEENRKLKAELEKLKKR